MNTKLLFLVAFGFATPAYAATVDELGYGFKYRVAADGTPTNGTPLSPFGGFAERSGDVAVDTISAVATGVQHNPFDPTSVDVNNYAEVRGDLATGEIGVATGTTGRSRGNAMITLTDTVTIDLSDRSSDFLEVIDVGLDIDGSLGTNPLVNSQLLYGFTINANARDAVSNFFNDSVWSNNQIASNGGRRHDGDVELLDDDPFKLRGTLELTGGFVYDIVVSQTLDGLGKTSFLGTSSLIFDTDAAFTSASGTFLSANSTTTPTTAVPIPPAGALIIAAFAGLMGMRKKAVV